MPTTKRTFLKGKMNLDIDERLLQDGEYGPASNIRVSNSEGSDVGAIEKSLSNKELTTLSLGSNIYTLASLRDEFEEKIYWAVLSDNGCYIIEYEVGTNTPAFVLQDTRSGALNILGFVPDKRLQMVLIVDSDNGNRLLGFTDNNTQPKLINVERSKTYGENGFNEEMILLIKKPPLFAPTLSLSVTPDVENNLEEKFLRFATRNKYLDGEYSALSPLSDIAFGAKTFSYDYDTGTNQSMLNVHNTVDISFDTGSSLVTDIEIVYKESGSNTYYIIETLNKVDNSWADNSLQTFNFTNNKKYSALAEKELFRLYDNVPLLAKAIAVINNRIVFGNYTENFNLIDSNNDSIVIDIEADKIPTTILLDTPTKSVKSNRDYELAIVYLDDYGRMTTALTSVGNTVQIPNYNSIDKNQIKATIKNYAPEFASYYRFFIKQNKADYDILLPSLFYEDDEYRWIKIEKSDIDKINEGDYLVVKADSSSVITNFIKTKVLEIKEQPQNFLQPEDEDVLEIIEKPGTYFKIKPKGFSINKDDYYSFFQKTYHNSRDRYENCLKNGTSYVYDPVFYGTLLNDMTLGVSTSVSLANNVGKRFKVLIDSLQTSANGIVNLTGGASGSVDSITVNGVEIMSGAVSFNTNLDNTASLVAANITSNTSSPNYTALAVGAVITITSETTGTSVNGFAVVSSATTITTTDVNMIGGSENTFKWNDDNSEVYPNENIPITAGVEQLLSDGIYIKFNADTGHSTDDEWNFYACGKLVSDDSRAYGWFRTVGDYGETQTSSGLTVADEVIENGAVIDLDFNEYGNPPPYSFLVSEISSSKYNNIMEWYFREDIATKIQESATELGYGAFDFNHLYFKRCILDHQSGSAEYSEFDTDGFMTMVVRSQGFGDIDRKKVSATTNIIQSASSRLVFETNALDENQDIFNEIGQTYSIVDGFHIGNGGSDINQTDILDAEIILPFYNCYAWGNAVESYKIRDEFNAKSFKIDTRPIAIIEDYRQNKRIASYTYSNVYEQTTNYNALNEFNLALENYNDLDDKYGSIQAMVSWQNDLDVWQEDKVVKVFYDKSVMYNKDGTSNLSKSDDILKEWVPYSGEYGISTHPEGLSVYGNYAYWPDAKRGVFLRKGQSGIEVISNFGIKDWTRDAMTNLTTFILGCYDPYFGQYVVSLNGYTLSFNELGNGWTSFHSWIPDEMVRINNRFYTIKNGQLYLHNDGDNTQVNTFYGVKYSSTIETVLNEAPSEDKVFKNIIQESNKPWKVTIETNLSSGSIEASEFKQRESKWFAHTRKNENGELNDRVQGIGNIISVATNEITFGQMPTLVSIGEVLYQTNSGTEEEIGVIDDIQGNIITVGTIVTTPVSGLFAYSVKDGRVQGSEIRGYYAKVTLENDDDENVELFAINSNIIKSFAPTEHR